MVQPIIRFYLLWSISLSILFLQCRTKTDATIGSNLTTGSDSLNQEMPVDSVQLALNRYAKVDLTTDLSKLSAKEKEMIPLLIDAAKIMDDLFWKESYGNKADLLDALPGKSAQE